ncbi:MAG: diguanylate cyclase [Candidatus Omnitrophota bacterium]
MSEEVHKDYLTGFPLRDSFYSLLKKLIIDHESTGKNFCVLIIDIDHFKKRNDKFGHLFGDDILGYIADALRLFFPQDQCYRYGGDEFTIILDNKEPYEAYYLAKQLKVAIENRPFLQENKSYKPFKITLSCGIAGFPHDAQTVEDLIRKADEALYFSKRHGRNSITMAGKTKYIKLRNATILATCVSLIAGLLIALFYQLPFKSIVYNTMRSIKSLRIITEPENRVKITLKNGRVLNGIISSETDRTITLNVSLKTGAGTLILKKSEIFEIDREENRPIK